MHGYRTVSLQAMPYLAHRVAWAITHGVWPNEIDHINGVRDDNRICNLRNVDRTTNCRNVVSSRKSASGAVGVRRKRPNLWQATIGGKHLGNFKTREDAIAARIEAERLLGYIRRAV